MSPDRDQLKETISALKQQRDELALQIHLGSMEAKEEFKKAQDKLTSLAAEFEPFQEAVEESASNVLSALGLVGEEVLKSFERIRKSLT